MGDVTLYRRMLRQARPYTLHFGALFALGLLASPIALLNPVPLKIVVDSVLGARPLPAFLQALLPVAAGRTPATMLAVAIGLLVLVTALGQAQGLASTLLRTYLGERLVLDFRARLVNQVQRLSLSYHDSRGTADSLYRIQQDGPAIQSLMVDGAVPVVSAAITFGTMVAVTTRLDWQLALVGLAISPPLFFLSRAFRPRLRRQSRQAKKLESSALAVGHVRSGLLTLGQLLLVMGYLGQLYQPLKTISQKAGTFQSYFASAERAFALLDERPDVPERPHAGRVERATGAVTFRNVSFAYDPAQPVLEDVSFEVPPGARVAVVGATGAGKTTLVSLLTRFYDPSAGAILLDGVDLRDYRLADLRDQFAIVLQEPV